jgi:hypothetical protein
MAPKRVDNMISWFCLGSIPPIVTLSHHALILGNMDYLQRPDLEPVCSSPGKLHPRTPSFVAAAGPYSRILPNQFLPDCYSPSP